MLYRFCKHCPLELPQAHAHQSRAHDIHDKQTDLYLQWCELNEDFAGGSLLFCSVHLNWLLWINETKQVQTESVPVWEDPEMCGQQSGIGIWLSVCS